MGKSDRVCICTYIYVIKELDFFNMYRFRHKIEHLDKIKHLVKKTKLTERERVRHYIVTGTSVFHFKAINFIKPSLSLSVKLKV